MQFATASPRKSLPSNDRTLTVVGVVAMIAVVFGFAFALGRLSADVAVGAVVIAALAVLSLPVLQVIARRNTDLNLFPWLAGGLAAKFAFSLVRYFVIFTVYGGAADAARYDANGWIVAQEIRSANFGSIAQFFSTNIDATRRIELITGMIYSLIGRSPFGAFFIFSWFAFWGTVLFILGFRRAVPEADSRRALLLVLFLPSLLFWPASVGKDALMLFGLGLVSYGAALLLSARTNAIGAAPFAVGFVLLLNIRPHVALMAVLGLGLAFVAGVLSPANVGSAKGRVIRLVALVLVLVSVSLAASRIGRLFSDNAGEAISTQDALNEALRRSSTGGSEFSPPAVTSPVQIPWAFVSVTTRPFPWEAKSALLLVASGETIGLLGLTAIGWKRVRRWTSLLARRPFLVFCAGYSLLFAISFSYIGNFGILARQRTSMLPFLMVPIMITAIPRKRPGARPTDATDSPSLPLGGGASPTRPT